MTTLRMTADVKDDRRVVLTLPLEVPTGMAALVVTVEPQQGRQPPRGVPAAKILGIAAGNGSPPDDDTVKQWIHEHRAEKYG